MICARERTGEYNRFAPLLADFFERKTLFQLKKQAE
jgi:hypothetical protein